jgi:hypothetical protein
MADFFLIVELLKYYELENSKLMIHNSYTYKTKVTTNTVIDSYFYNTFSATEDNTNKQTLNIKGIYVDIETSYSLQTSVDDCEDNEKSFYFDITEQMLYIHFDHTINPYTVIVEYGKVFGYTNDKIRNFNGIDYIPMVKEIPNFSLRVDPLRYTRQSHLSGNVIMNNTPVDGSSDGTFDSNDEFTGNDIFMLYGLDGYTYSELILITNNYIENTIVSLNEVVVITKDKREKETPTAPTDTFSLTDFPDMDNDLDGIIKPDGYGRLRGVPGICVNSEQAGNKTFYFASVIQAAPAPVFRCKQDEKWTIIVPSATDYANGMATFATADVHVDGDNTKGLEDVFCTGYFRPYYNPGDIIADLNLRFNSIAYNSSNYNTTEWEDEKQYLEDVGLYMPDEKELFEYIEQLQNGSTVGFQYFFHNGKRTLRLDNPNRNIEKTIYAQEILNELEFNNNEDFFSTHAVICYRENYTTDKKFRYKNTDYYLEVLRQHRKSNQYKCDCLMWDESEAQNKSVIIMEDQKKERPTGTIILHGIDNYILKLFDIIYAEISQPGQKFSTEKLDLYRFGDTGDIYRFGDLTSVDVYRFTDYTRKDIIVNYREFLGWERFQIIGITPDFKNGNTELEIRQRDYSDEYESITGYIPT